MLADPAVALTVLVLSLFVGWAMKDPMGFSGPAPIRTDLAPLRSSTSRARTVNRCAASKRSG